MISSSGLVDIKKIAGDTYVTITEKGDDVSEKLLRTDSDDMFKVKKGVKIGSGYDRVAKDRKKIGRKDIRNKFTIRRRA
jgi:hypothetical protein